MLTGRRSGDTSSRGFALAASVTGSAIKAADELSVCYSHITVIMTNLLLVYASDE